MKIGFIGCGNMGGALASAISKNEGCEIYLSNHSPEKAQALAEKIGATVVSNNDIAQKCNFIFMGVKPGIICSVLSNISGALFNNANAVIVTMAAGVDMDSVDRAVGGNKKIVRIMPNTPVTVGKGMTTWCDRGLSDKDEKNFIEIMKNTGNMDKIPESMMDSASALAGCGPAFVYMFAEAIADGGIACGLPRDKAIMYAAETIKGAAEMMLKTGKHPGQLRDEVCSPGGSTIEGVCALKSGNFDSLSAGAVVAAYEKTKKLGK